MIFIHLMDIYIYMMYILIGDRSPPIMPNGGIVQFGNNKRDIQISCNGNHVTNLYTHNQLKCNQQTLIYRLIVATFKKASA
jgi:hypothetical protein